MLDTAVRSVLDHPAWQVEGSALAAGFNMELVPPGTLPLAAQSHQDPKWLWVAGLAGLAVTVHAWTRGSSTWAQRQERNED